MKGAIILACGIYKFENLINHMVYIGQAIDLEGRYNKHYKNIADKYHQEDLYKAFREFGFSNFSYEILEEFEDFNQEKLNQLECYYIEKFDSIKPNGYNMVPGGTNGAGLAKGKVVCQYDLQGNFIAEYPSAHQANYATGINYSSICACCRNEITHTKNFQWKYLDSDKQINDITNNIKIQSNTPIWQYDLNENFIKEYKNFNEAANNIKVSKAALCNCLKGKTSSCAGYKWSYANAKILKQPKKSWNGKKIGQFDKNNNLIKIYNSALEASKETGISNISIGKVCNGKAKSAGKYYWKFIIEENI